jgi:hypothetical protein
MIERTMSVCVLEEGFIMATDFPSADQRVSPAQVWAQLTPDLQVHIIRLVAQLAAHLVLAEEEHAQHARKETCDALSSIAEQDPI